jgi:hypothetical protein
MASTLPAWLAAWRTLLAAGQYVPKELMHPSPETQIQFMVNIQRPLDEGLFTASYKFALLLALAVDPKAETTS